MNINKIAYLLNDSAAPSQDLRDQLRRLRTLVRTIPHDLRFPLRQPCFGLFLEDAMWRKSWLSDLEHGLQQLAEEAWAREAKVDRGNVLSACSKYVFTNYAFLQSVDDSQVDNLRLRFWRSRIAGGVFSRSEYDVRVENLSAILSEPPEAVQNEDTGWATILSSINLTSLLRMASLYVVFTLYLYHSFAE